MTLIINFIFNFCNFSVIICFFNKATKDILFSTVINTVFVAKLLILGIFPSISVFLESESVFLTRPLVSGSLFSTVFNAVFVAKLLIQEFYRLFQLF